MVAMVSTVNTRVIAMKTTVLDVTMLQEHVNVSTDGGVKDVKAFAKMGGGEQTAL